MTHPTVPGIPQIRIVHPAAQVLPPGGRLGVLGGAYNPITLAHLAIARTIVTTFAMDEVLFLLPQVPPHKPIFGASLEQRLDMMRLAVQDCPYAAVGLSSHGLFVDMYQGLLEVYTQQPEVFFLTGRDAAERILTWKYDDAPAALEQMFTSFQLIVCDRDGPFHIPDDPLLAPYRHRIHTCVLPATVQTISATAVRQCCKEGRPLDDLVPAAVAEYIVARQLYSS